MEKMLPGNMLAHTRRRKHKSKANNAYLFMNLLSTCSGPGASSISLLFQSVTENMHRWRDETVRKYRAGRDEEGEEEEEDEEGGGLE